MITQTLKAVSRNFFVCFSLFFIGCGSTSEQYDPTKSAARNWNEALLVSIENDQSRPTVHARNLFHSSAMMYDLWAIYDDTADTFFLGQTIKGQKCAFTEKQREYFRRMSLNLEDSRKKAISHAMYKLLNYRFENSPGAPTSKLWREKLFKAQGYDENFTSTDLSSGDPRALGNYLAECWIEFGKHDGSNEENGFKNQHYETVNEPLKVYESGTPGMADPNRWQPLQYQTVFVGQGGFRTETNQPDHLSPEWGEVFSFALPPEEFTSFARDDYNYLVCHDPGHPAYLTGDDATPEAYQWNHTMVVLWSSHLDPSDEVMWDISPNNIGNVNSLPKSFEEMKTFYDDLDGGVQSEGHRINPKTGKPYKPQLVPRGDYTRVLAEFWADGPKSETPPGHWFSITNEAVHDHPDFKRLYKGVGPELDALEWDVKLYFALGSAVHDAAVTAWGIKGRYDSARPISAIRYMASLGQSSDPDAPRYDPLGLPLIEGKIELVKADDPLAGEGGENIDKIKVKAWKGPKGLKESQTGSAGVGWILADDWVPYQPSTFVSPPFAGYISGHSTFSRTAAELLTAFTGDEYFPGGLAEFVAKKNEFLRFEKGPSVDVVLQWATYRDASDETSLSRIWGGIHPAMDDIPGRIVGQKIAADVMEKVETYFNGTAN